jgi:hypothetical protein
MDVSQKLLKELSELNPIRELGEELVGPLYDKLCKDKEFAIRCLANEDYRVRMAAITACLHVWKFVRDESFLAACRSMATEDSHENARTHAINALGEAFRETKDGSWSEFLANIALETKNSSNVRFQAYWALREVQLGVHGDDLHQMLFGILKRVYDTHSLPLNVYEIEKRRLLEEQGLPDTAWDSADQIDLSFVRQYASGS